MTTVGDPLLETVRTIVARIAGPDRMPAPCGPETRLAEDCWLDSVELLEIVLACEATFGIAFDAAHDFQPDAFATVGSLTALVRSKRSQGEAS
jgi:acyl carrier protein